MSWQRIPSLYTRNALDPLFALMLIQRRLRVLPRSSLLEVQHRTVPCTSAPTTWYLVGFTIVAWRVQKYVLFVVLESMHLLHTYVMPVSPIQHSEYTQYVITTIVKLPGMYSSEYYCTNNSTLVRYMALSWTTICIVRQYFTCPRVLQYSSTTRNGGKYEKTNAV